MVYIDLDSPTYFLKLVTSTSNSTYISFLQNFTQNITEVCFKHYQNLFQDTPHYKGYKEGGGRSGEVRS